MLTRASDGPSKNGGDESVNPGSNLFVTGIHPSLKESEVADLFGKHGEVEKCNIMRDPHTHDSRGFGFVKMVTAEDAERAREALQGEVIEGRTLSIEKARRARPRTPTPGKYYGPPKRGTSLTSADVWAPLNLTIDDRPPRGGFGRDRYDVSACCGPFPCRTRLTWMTGPWLRTSRRPPWRLP